MDETLKNLEETYEAKVPKRILEVLGYETNLPWNPVELYQDQRRLEEAERAFRNEVDGRTQSMGISSKSRLNLLETLALILAARKDLSAAETVCRETVEGSMAAFGEDDDQSHFEIWPRVITHLSEIWERDPKAMKRHLEKHCYGLPRGRVTLPVSVYLILHGDDSPIPDWKEPVMQKFNILRHRVKPLFDEHERTLREAGEQAVALADVDHAQLEFAAFDDRCEGMDDDEGQCRRNGNPRGGALPITIAPCRKD